MTGDEHLAESKRRALANLDRGQAPMEAVTALLCDLDRHDETKRHPGIQIGVNFMMIGKLRTPAEAREFIEGFR